jgi:methionyl-tRNA synthetase
VQALLRRIQEAGYIETGRYSGYYCVGCEAFKLERDLVDGKCPDHPTRDVKWVEETNFFFKLGQFRDRLLEFYEEHARSGADFVRPVAKFNEIRNVVREWDRDYTMSVSRSRAPWGIPWPDDDTHTIYVWFDALINYLSATGFPDAEFETMWPADVHIIGPDIVRFHAAIWPAMLMAAGLPLPRGVWCHGWVNTSGARFSKSAGVTLTLRNAIDRHGPEALRYFLLREVPWDADGNFSWERFDIRYTSELADGYGNLASRILAMVTKYRGGRVPDTAIETELDGAGHEAIARYRSAMDDHLIHEGGSAVWGLVAHANKYVEDEAPWALAKNKEDGQLDLALSSLVRTLTRITIMASPFMPEKTQQVWTAVGFPGHVSEASWRDLEHPRVAAQSVARIKPLFPKPEAVA